MQDENVLFGLSDLGKIFISLNSLEKSGFRKFKKKKKNSLRRLRCYPLRRYGVYQQSPLCSDARR